MDYFAPQHSQKGAWASMALPPALVEPDYEDPLARVLQPGEDRPPPPSPEERRRKARARLERQDAIYRAPPEDLQPFRLRLAWRLTRALARALCGARQGDLLRESTKPSPTCPNPWLHPPHNPPEDSVARTTFEASGRLPMSEWIPIPEPYTKRSGFGLLPPSTPRLRELWCLTISRYAESLYMADPHYSDVAYCHALEPLTDPSTCLQTWPSPKEIVLFEHRLVETLAMRMAKSGILAFREHLQKSLYLTPSELEDTLALTRDYMVRLTSMDVEQARAMMVIKLEDLAARARDAMKIKDELQTYKHLSSILGLTRTKPDDINMDMLEAVKFLDREEQAQAPAPLELTVEPSP